MPQPHLEGGVIAHAFALAVDKKKVDQLRPDPAAVDADLASGDDDGHGDGNDDGDDSVDDDGDADSPHVAGQKEMPATSL